jgi:formylglycine-generating enzyme required for sulfatase activity
MEERMLGSFRATCLFITALTLADVAAIHADVFNMPAGLTSLQFVTVGNAGNTVDTTGFGAVVNDFGMGKFDITAGQYCAFLNAVATTADPRQLYNQYMDVSKNPLGCNIVKKIENSVTSYSVANEWANRPVNYVSWADAARFCNWMQNGQPTGAEGATTTETGAYTLNGAMTNAELMAVVRNASAQYFIPNANEWYKAAYYDPNKPGGAGYWTYPTKSDTPPVNVLSSTGTNNANYGYAVASPYRTDVGVFAASPGPYGTFDQGGNVAQWVESKYSNLYRELRGGSYATAVSSLASSASGYIQPLGEDSTIGFRIAGFVQTQIFTWKGSNDDTKTAWGVAGNWTPLASVPDGPGVNVAFGTQPSSCSIVDMISVGRTVANIIFLDTTSTLIQSTYGYSLTLDNRNSLATVAVTGSHFISTPVILNSDACISGSGLLTIWGSISGTHTLTVSGQLAAANIQVNALTVPGRLSAANIEVNNLTVTGQLMASAIRATTLKIGGTSGAQCVPEPCGLILLAVGLSLAALVWKRSQ